MDVLCVVCVCALSVSICISVYVCNSVCICVDIRACAQLRIYAHCRSLFLQVDVFLKYSIARNFDSHGPRY